MDTVNNTSRILGAAFLLQFVTSLTAGLIWKNGLIVPDNIHKTMLTIANHPGLLRIHILGDMLTAVGVTFLGVALFIVLRKYGEIMALLGLGCYILEGAILASSKIATFALLRISQAYVAAGHPAALQASGNLAVEAADFGMTLMMAAFSVGGILFYYLLDKARIVPRTLSLWGLITVFPCLIGTLSSLLGYKLPFFMYFPYVPFEFVIGIWIAIKGIKE